MQNSGRISFLDPSSTVSEAEAQRRRRELASLVIRGFNRRALAKHFDVHVDTISNWTQRPDMQALIATMGRQRTDRLIHRIDSEFESRLEKIKSMEIEDIIKLRKELVPQRLEIASDSKDAAALQELMQNEIWGRLPEEGDNEGVEEPERVPSDSPSGPDTGR